MVGDEMERPAERRLYLTFRSWVKGEFYSVSNGELLEGFKEGSGMNCCLLLKITQVAVWRMNCGDVNMELGNQQGSCAKTQMRWQGLV